VGAASPGTHTAVQYALQAPLGQPRPHAAHAGRGGGAALRGHWRTRNPDRLRPRSPLERGHVPLPDRGAPRATTAASPSISAARGAARSPTPAMTWIRWRTTRPG